MFTDILIFKITVSNSSSILDCLLKSAMAISTIFSCAYFKVCKLAIPFALSPVHLKCMPGLKYQGVLFHSTFSLLYSIVLKGLTTLLTLYRPHCKTLWVVPVPRRNLTNPEKLYHMVIAFQYLLNLSMSANQKNYRHFSMFNLEYFQLNIRKYTS